MTTTHEDERIASVLAGIQDHGRLSAWLKGQGIDKALKAMNISAVSKRPGRVLKRVAKELGQVFRAPKVVAWDKQHKTVHASAISQAALSEVALNMDGLEDVLAVYQTDLYFRANQEVTEVNASTVSAISLGVMEKLAAAGADIEDFDLDREAAKALNLARIFETGVRTAGFGAMECHFHVLPKGEMAMLAVSLPIHRVEFDKELVGKFVYVFDVVPLSQRPSDEQDGLAELAHAMTRDGHPGEEAFAKMVARLAQPYPAAMPEAGA